MMTPAIWQLAQSWLPEAEPYFHPGSVRISREGSLLQIDAALLDEEVSTTASAHQQRLWEHGDVFELFIQHGSSCGYYEFQIAPNGFTLAIYYPDLSSVRGVRSGERRMEEFLSDTSLEAKASKTTVGWKASLAVPLLISSGESVRVSCCRYDYGEGRPPVLSSTSPHSVRDFHRPQDWREISF